MRTRLPLRFRKRSERGYALVAVMVAVTLMVIALAVVAPRISTQIKRDREEELVRRGKQYVRAIQLYYRKFGRFPASVEQLESTNNIRFLRRRWPDPITGKDEWRMIHFGQAKPKPLTSWQKAKKDGGITPAAALSSTGTGVTGTGQAVPAGPGGAVNASDISKPLSNSNGSLGGGAIVGVSSTSEKTGLKEIDGKTKYNEWEFVYDPSLDPNMRNRLNPGPGTAPNQPGGPVRPGGAADSPLPPSTRPK